MDEDPVFKAMWSKATRKYHEGRKPSLTAPSSSIIVDFPSQDTAPSVVSVASVVSDTWPKMDAAAYHGLAGDVVKAIEPHSESDPVAILIQFLALAGNAMGRTAYHLVEDTRHHTNLFAVLVGESSKARKGTSLNRVRAIMRVAAPEWNDSRLRGGLSSGEGFYQRSPRPAS